VDGGLWVVLVPDSPGASSSEVSTDWHIPSSIGIVQQLQRIVRKARHATGGIKGPPKQIMNVEDERCGYSLQIEEPVASKPDARQLIRKQLCRLSLSTVLLRLKAPLLAGDTKAEGNLLIPQGLEVEYVFCDALLEFIHG
jgi:hypothetical protein